MFLLRKLDLLSWYLVFALLGIQSEYVLSNLELVLLVFEFFIIVA